MSEIRIQKNIGKYEKKWGHRGSNAGPLDLQSTALPAELCPRWYSVGEKKLCLLQAAPRLKAEAEEMGEKVLIIECGTFIPFKFALITCRFVVLESDLASNQSINRVKAKFHGCVSWNRRWGNVFKFCTDKPLILSGCQYSRYATRATGESLAKSFQGE